MSIFVTIAIVSGLSYLVSAIYFSVFNRHIHTVFYHPHNAQNDEASLRWFLFKYPNATIFVPDSDVNSIMSIDNPRIKVL